MLQEKIADMLKKVIDLLKNILSYIPMPLND